MDPKTNISAPDTVSHASVSWSMKPVLRVNRPGEDERSSLTVPSDVSIVFVPPPNPGSRRCVRAWEIDVDIDVSDSEAAKSVE